MEIRVVSGDALLTGPGLWLDPHRKRDFAFVSHAHADHFAAHGRILCSTTTRRLIESRFGGKKVDFLGLDPGEVHRIGDEYEVELLPAGHIPGSAMLFCRRVSDGATLLHTGDFKTRPPFLGEANCPRRADTLIMETTFGVSKFRLPPSAQVVAAMTKFAREALEERSTPVFMAYSLGKAQEILAALHREGPELRFQVHATVARMNETLVALGYELPPWEIFDPKERPTTDRVVVIPPAAGRGLAMRRLGTNIQLAMVSGWGLDGGAKYRYQCDEVFALSDHAGYDDLLAFVAEVAPRRVYTIHGYREEFARDLRARGIEAWPLAGVTQLELNLAGGAGLRGFDAGADPVELSEPERPCSEFGRFTSLCEELEAATGRFRKREILAEYLRSLPAESLLPVTTYLSGKAFPRSAEVRGAKVGWAVVRQALLAVTGLTLRQYREISSGQADAVRMAHLLLRGKTRPQPHTIAWVAAFFSKLAARRAQGEKVTLLREALEAFHPTEGALLVGLLTGELRIGLKEGLLEEAIAEAFAQSAEEVRRAHLLTGDPGQAAAMAREGRLSEAEATWFTPIKPMLASPVDDVEDIVSRLAGDAGTVWVEDKFDGIRAQLHRRGERVEIYSRDLRPLHDEFPELVVAARQLRHDVILDGEIIAFAEGKRVTFFDLQKRLGRLKAGMAQGDLFRGEAVPVRFIAFDLLGFEGQGWLERPLRERREALDSLKMPENMEKAGVEFAVGVAGVETAFGEAKRRGNGGLIAKGPGSIYTPGRRGKQWLKLKEISNNLPARSEP